MNTTTTEIAPKCHELGFYLRFDLIDDEQAHTLRERVLFAGITS